MAPEVIDGSLLDNLIVTPPRRVIRHKSPAELAAQVAAAEILLGEPFLRDEKRTAEVLTLDAKELKERYPRRYADYLKLVREISHLKQENYAMAEKEFSEELGEDFIELSRQDKTAFITPSALTPTSAQLARLKAEIDHDHEVISARNYLRMVANLEEYIERYELGHAEGGPLREHQQDVCHDFARFLNSDNGRHGYINLGRSGIVDMPTGTGKTAVFVELIEALAGHPKAGQKAPIKTLVIVPSKDLIQQTIGDETRGFRAFAPNLHVTSYYQHDKDLSGDVVVTTYQSFIPLIQRGLIGPDMFDLIIADEAHHALGDKARQAIDQLMTMSTEALLVGFTATTEYSEDEDRQVRSVFGTEIHQLGLREAIERRILAPVDWDYFATDPNSLQDYRGRFLQGNDYSPALLDHLNNQERNRQAVTYVQQALLSGRQTLVSCLPMNRKTGERHLETMADLINDAAIALPVLDPASGQPILDQFTIAVARAIDGRMSDDDRKQILDDYRKGRIHVLTFVDVLKEGVDLPNAKVLINLRPTRSPVLAIQRLGRTLRNTGQRAWVVEFRDPMGGQFAPYDMDRIMQDDPSGTRVSGPGAGGGDPLPPRSVVLLPDITMGAHEIRGGSLDHTVELPKMIETDHVVRDPDQPEGHKVYIDVMGREWQPIGGILEKFQLSRAYLQELFALSGIRGILKTQQDQPTQKHLLFPVDEIQNLLGLTPLIKDMHVMSIGQRWLDGKGVAYWLRSMRQDLQQVRVTPQIVSALLQMYFDDKVHVLPARRSWNGVEDRYELVYNSTDLLLHADKLAEYLINFAHERRRGK